MFGSSHMFEPLDGTPSDLPNLDGLHTSVFAQESQVSQDFASRNTVGTSQDSSTLPNSSTITASYDHHSTAGYHNLPSEIDMGLVDPRLVAPAQGPVAASRHETATPSSDTPIPNTTTTSSSQLSCDICTRTYKTKGQLQRHRSEKHQAYTAKGMVRKQNKARARPFKCNIGNCTQDFLTKWELNQHQENIHNPNSKYQQKKKPGSFPCTVAGCLKVCGTRLSLYDHIRRGVHDFGDEVQQ
ncbi:hypothetical protein PG984_009930 [Apiospora sp. TS-2023a]